MEIIFLVQSVITTESNELIILVPYLSDAFRAAFPHLEAIQNIKGATQVLYYMDETLDLSSVNKESDAERQVQLRPEMTFIVYGNVRTYIPPIPCFVLSFRTGSQEEDSNASS